MNAGPFAFRGRRLPDTLDRADRSNHRRYAVTVTAERKPDTTEAETADVTWPRPPVSGFTAEDLDRIPDLPPHTELIDGSLVFVSPQRIFHTVAIKLIAKALNRLAPDGYLALPEMTIILGPRQRPEPDVVVVHAGAVASRAQ